MSRVFAAVLAGGSGTRMRQTLTEAKNLPKQFLPLAGEPILVRTVRRFLQTPEIDFVAVGMNAAWVAYTEELLNAYFPQEQQRLTVFAGGETRSDTLLRVINGLQTRFGEDAGDILLTHDAVRPFVTGQMIRESIAAVQKYGAATVAIPTVDTLFTSADGETVASVPDRSLYWNTQTPQSFFLSELKEMYLSLSPEEKQTLTDANRIYLLRGKPVHIVCGSAQNLKITTAEDYRIACALAEPPK